MRFSRIALLQFLACLSQLCAQLPQITQGGVVNAASWSAPVAPGGIVAIFGANLAATQQSATIPWPTSLAGTSVTIGGIPAPLAFVSSTQINAYVPASLPSPGANISAVPVIVTTSAGSGAASLVALATGAPGFFTADASGCGQAAALNIRPGATSINSSANSAAPGDYIALFGTGLGPAAQQPADGAAAPGASSLQSQPRVFIDGNAVSVSYAGLAPTLAGIDQMDFQIPASTRNGCAVPVSASQILGSPSVTIAVQSGRGQCSDPPIQSWGQLSLYKAVYSGPGSAAIPPAESFSASFPAGPGVMAPAPAAIVYAPDYVGNAPAGGAANIASALPIALRTCQIPGYSNLSAGSIQLQPPAGTPVTVQPQPLLTGGVTYALNLPTGFIVPGVFHVSGSQGSAVSLMASFAVGSPIQLQTGFPPGAVVSGSQPLTIKWTGGDPGSLVKLSLISGQGLAGLEDYSYADAAAGSLTIQPKCAGAVCSFGLPLSSEAQILIQVMAAQPAANVPGVTAPVLFNWQYSYNFSGLTLAQ